RGPIHDISGRTLDRQALPGQQGPLIVERLAQRIDDPANQALPDRHIDNMATALNLVASVQQPIISKQHNANLIFIDIEGNALNAAGENKYLFKADTRQAGDAGNTGGNAGDVVDFPGHYAMNKGVAALLNSGESRCQYLLQSIRRHWLYLLKYWRV